MITSEELLAVGRAFMIALLFAGIAAYPVYLLLLRLKSRQVVSAYLPEHQTKQGTPTMGGLIIVAGVLAGTAAYLLSSKAEGPPIASTSLLLVAGFALIGFTDDFLVPRMVAGKRGLGWKQKILMQAAVAAVAVGVMYGWRPDGGFWFTILLVLAFANAYNFADGLDGLAASILLAYGAGVVGLAILSGSSIQVAAIVAACAAGAIPFMFLNAPPAKVFMGDVGSLPVGAVLGLAVSQMVLGSGSAAYFTISNVRYGESTIATPVILRPALDPSLLAIPLAVLSLVLIAELVPGPLQILSVKLRGRRLFPRTPIHHAFESKGWPESRIVWCFALTQLVLAALALFIYATLAAEPGLPVIERASREVFK